MTVSKQVFEAVFFMLKISLNRQTKLKLYSFALPNAKQMLVAPQVYFPVTDGGRGIHLFSNGILGYLLKGWTGLKVNHPNSMHFLHLNPVSRIESMSSIWNRRPNLNHLKFITCYFNY